MNYKNFSINTVGTPPGWGAREEQAWKNIIDTVVGDAIGGVMDVNGHKHDILYETGGNGVVYATAEFIAWVGTNTPLEYIAGGGSNYTGNGLHIKSDIVNDIECFLIIEGASLHPNGGGHGAAKLVFADTDGGINNRIIEFAHDVTAFVINLANDNLTLNKSLLGFVYGSQFVNIYHATNNIQLQDVITEWFPPEEYAQGRWITNIAGDEYWIALYRPPV